MIRVVPGRPAAGGAVWWALVPAGTLPAFRLAEGQTPGAKLVKHLLNRAGDGMAGWDAYLVAATGLGQDAWCALEVTAGGERAVSRTRTLPVRLAGGTRFTIALASCYCISQDNGPVGAGFPPPFHRPPTPDPVRFRFLAGDQVYMDLKYESGSPIVSLQPPDPWTRYQRQWDDEKKEYARFLAASPSLTLADDHEFWNDYPHKALWLPWSGGGRDGPTGRMMDRTFALFQAGLNLDPATVAGVTSLTQLDQLLNDGARSPRIDVPPLSFFALDTRTVRTKGGAKPEGFATAGDMQRATAWLAGLTGPGVLILAQPAVDRIPGFAQRVLRSLGLGDHNLADYESDFAALWEAMFNAPHDVLILSGDIHWSRLYRVQRGQGSGVGSRVVWELISSPLARIPKLPLEGKAKVPGEREGKVEWKGGYALWKRWTAMASTDGYATVAEQTYATVTFTTRGQGSGVGVTARAWRPRAPSPELLLESEFTLR